MFFIVCFRSIALEPEINKNIHIIKDILLKIQSTEYNMLELKM